MKYLHTLIGRKIPENIVKTLQEQPARSGMYNWIQVFKGDIKTFWDAKECLEDYDVVQVNMSPIDMPMIPELRHLLKGSSTKLVINNDYVCEYWGKFDISPMYYEQVQRMGDMVFSTEQHQVSNMIKGTYCLTHPTNTHAIKHMGTGLPLQESVGFIYHWWAGMTYLPGLLLNKIKKKYGLKRISMYGYDNKWDEQQKWNGLLFDNIAPLSLFPDFAEQIQTEKVLYDPNPFHTYGRNGVELACWKLPVVGSNRVFSYQMLFPELTIDPFDRIDAKDKFKKVFKGQIDNILDNAYENVEYFNYKNSEERWRKAFDESIDRGGHEWYQKNNQ